MKHQQEEIVFSPRFSWGELLDQQPKWITDLIAHIEHNDIADTIEYKDKEKGLIAVSDGSEKIQIVASGWILYSRSGNRLGHAAGTGLRGNSLRAEGTGMLSIALFLGLMT